MQCKECNKEYSGNIDGEDEFFIDGDGSDYIDSIQHTSG